MSKPKIAFYWCSSCGGCEEAVIDINEELLNLNKAVDIVFWPAAMDFKYDDIKRMSQNEIAACFINGSIRGTENLEMVKQLREKSALVIAFGSCAYIGGIPGLANLYSKSEIFNTVYKHQPSIDNPNNTFPQENFETDYGILKLPEFHKILTTIDKAIDVDYYLPGCAPPADLIINVIDLILKRELPKKGTVLASEKSLCHYCSRKDSKPEKLSIKNIKRVHEIQLKEDECFLAQGVLCLGPATRGGCGEKCISANMPCRGCFGPLDGVIDQGGKFLSAFASIIDYTDDSELEIFVDSIADMIGTFYRFSLPASLLGNKKGDKD